MLNKFINILGKTVFGHSWRGLLFTALFAINIPPFGGAWNDLYFGSFASAQWKAYPSYYEPTEIEQAGDGTLYVLASGGLYSYNPTDHQLTTYDKTTALSDCGILHIAWCQTARRLVVIYDNYNIDLLSPNGNVVNMPAYMNTSMTVDKTVNSIDVAGRYAYLATAFGIIQINVANAEFTNTYNLGFRVDYSYVDGNYLYAASSTSGLYRGLMSDNLLDPSQWTRTSGYTARPKTMDADLLATVRTLNPGGPKYNYFGFLKFHNNKLFSAGGGWNAALDLGRAGTVQVLDNGDWTVYEDDIASRTGYDYVDLQSLDIDPTDENHVYAGGRTGLYEFNNGRLTNAYTVSTDGLASALGNDRNYVYVFGVLFDNSGSLWCLNGSNDQGKSILELSRDHSWTSHHHGELVYNGATLRAMQSPIHDSGGNLWFTNNHWERPALVCYNPSTDNIRVFTSFINEDGTTLTLNNGARCVAEDKDRNIWIGTERGPLMLEPSQMTADEPVFTQVKVPRNDGTDYADYLLSDVDVTSIVIDNANRKWFGTNGFGVYLISSSNITQLQHFTSENSPLVSNNIESMALDEATGELFIGTDKGLCSYTTPVPSPGEGMTKDNVYAYPNPVRPDYRGAITITGLDDNADVKIMTASGALVNEGTASGGQYRWYGLDRDGKRVASGVYMVAVATAAGEKGVVCKIAIVN